MPTQLSVLIDGFNLAMERGTGVATYARNLSYVCRDLGYRTDILYGRPTPPARSSLLTEVSFFDPLHSPSRIGDALKNVATLIPRPFGVSDFAVPVEGRVILRSQASRLPHFDQIWNSTNLFRKAETSFGLWGAMLGVRHGGPVDIAHWTYPLPVRARGARNIYTLHDLVPLRLPYTTLDNKSYYLRLMKRLVATADHIVTVSEASRQDIIQLLGCSEDKVTNTYQSVEIPAELIVKGQEQVAAEIAGAFGLEYKKYLLFFGAIEPKKNVGRLIEAYLASGAELPLVIIGSKAWKSDEELRLYNSLSENARRKGEGGRTNERIRYFDYVPFSLLVSAIRGAYATAFPSLYEGFGLPILESMLLGTPVITSNIGATKEVAGDAALLVDPYNIRDISEAIKKLEKDPELCEALQSAGRGRAAMFSASRIAEDIRKLYSRMKAA